MHILIAGAGAVGSHVAQALCFRGNDVTVIDVNEHALEALRERNDVMTLTGNAALPSVLVEAGVRNVDMALALTGSSEANLVICRLAKVFGVAKSLARLRTRRYFDADLSVPPEIFGVDEFIVPEEACVAEIMDSLRRPSVKESIPLGPKTCEIVNFQVPAESPLSGIALKDVPRIDLLARIRVCAIKRYGNLIVPHGDTTVNDYDEAYVAGNRRDVDAFIEWATPAVRPIKRVVVAGSTELAQHLGARIEARGMALTMIVGKEADVQDVVDQLGTKTTIISGACTEAPVLEEALVSKADAVVAVGADNEANILTCILAKRMGARKVITVVDNVDYRQIIANLTLIDCGFNPLLVAVDGVLQQFPSDIRQHVAILKRIEAEILDMVITPDAAVAGKQIAEIKRPADMVFIAILRDGEFVPPVGKETLRAGDRVAALVRRQSRDAVERFFARRRLF